MIRLREAEVAQAAKMAGRAKALWHDRETVPIAGTLGETYLRRRGITCPLPLTLRFQAEGWHATAYRFPMIVAIVEGTPDFAVHRTYLAGDGFAKAAIDPNRAMLGSVTGGAVRLSDALSRHVGATPWPLVVAEGIETGLSLQCGLLESPARVWAALSAHGMAKLALPATAGELIVAADGDKAGRGAAQALGERALRRGWQVSMLQAPEVMDWNDVLMAEGCGA